MRRLLAFLVALAALVAPAPAWPQDTVADFSAGPPSGTYRFPSWTPKTLGELMKGNEGGETVSVPGHLFLPQGADKAPAVVLMHGSGGIYRAMLDFWPRQFNAAGIAVLSVDSFGARGVKSTAEDQSLLPFAADSADAFAALRLLATHPRIDSKRIAIMGFSRGGITTWRAAVERIARSQKLPDGLRFAAFIPVYSGGCTGGLRLAVKPGVFSTAPMLWIHGESDDYTTIAGCREYADRIAKAGTPVEFLALEGTYHKFDAEDQVHFYGRGLVKALDNCPLEMDINDFAYYDRFTGQRLQGEAFQAAAKACMSRGATLEGNPRSRDKAAKAAVEFLRKTFSMQ